MEHQTTGILKLLCTGTSTSFLLTPGVYLSKDFTMLRLPSLTASAFSQLEAPYCGLSDASLRHVAPLRRSLWS